MGGTNSKQPKLSQHSAPVGTRGRTFATGGGNAALVNRNGRRSAASPRRGSFVDDTEERFPVVIRYGARSYFSRQTTLSVRLECDGFMKNIPMSRSGDDFFAFVQLPKGDQGYIVSVDGKDTPDNKQKKKEFPANVEGGVGNVLTVNEALFGQQEDKDAKAAATDGEWGQEDVVFSETRKLPPMIPPHLRYTPLNTPPTQHRCGADGNVAPVVQDHALDPEHLPLPLSVTLNHVYFQRREDHVVMGVTTRFRDKFTSVVYYKGTAGKAEPATGSATVPVAV